MRFSIQEQNGKKMFFHSPAAANKVTGLHLTTIKTILQRGNPFYHRKSDNKLFGIRKEPSIKLITIEGEDFFSLEEIEKEFGLSPTKFLNQVKNGRFKKKIDWISPELLFGNESETKKIDELEEMKKFQEKLFSRVETLEEENKRLFSRVEILEASLEAEKAFSPEKASPLSQEVFKPSRAFDGHSFNIQSVAKFIGDGFVCDIRSDGPKTRRYVVINDQRKYLPDLVKQIIREHIHPVLQNETKEEEQKRFESYIGTKGKINGLTLSELCKLRRGITDLQLSVISDIANEVMKLI